MKIIYNLSKAFNLFKPEISNFIDYQAVLPYI